MSNIGSNRSSWNAGAHFVECYSCSKLGLNPGLLFLKTRPFVFWISNYRGNLPAMMVLMDAFAGRVVLKCGLANASGRF